MNTNEHDITIEDIAERRLERLGEETTFNRIRITRDGWCPTVLVGPLTVRITATENYVHFAVRPEGQTPRIFIRLECGEDREIDILDGFGLWVRKEPYHHSAECLVEKVDARFPERYQEEPRHGVHTKVIPRYQVTREWYEMPIDGPCNFTIADVAGALEWQRHLPGTSGEAPYRVSHGECGGGMLCVGQSLWIRSAHPVDLVAEFSLTHVMTGPTEKPVAGKLESDGRWRELRSGEPIPTSGTEFMAIDGSWNPFLFGECMKAPSGMPKIRVWEEAKPQRMCGCGEHIIPHGADPYLAHRTWLGRREHSVIPSTYLARGVGVSAPPKYADVLVEIQHEDWV